MGKLLRERTAPTHPSNVDLSADTETAENFVGEPRQPGEAVRIRRQTRTADPRHVEDDDADAQHAQLFGEAVEDIEIGPQTVEHE